MSAAELEDAVVAASERWEAAAGCEGAARADYLRARGDGASRARVVEALATAARATLDRVHAEAELRAAFAATLDGAAS